MKSVFARQAVAAILFILMTGIPLIACAEYGTEPGYPATPRQRIRENAAKAQGNPSLRGRWVPEYYERASSEVLPSDNLAMEILSKIKEDETLANIPMRLQVRSYQGTVTLEGVVNSGSERSLVEMKVSRMAGVERVENKLRVKSSNEDLLRG